jgi:hypothetical protein
MRIASYPLAAANKDKQEELVGSRSKIAPSGQQPLDGKSAGLMK